MVEDNISMFDRDLGESSEDNNQWVCCILKVCSFFYKQNVHVEGIVTMVKDCLRKSFILLRWSEWKI